MKDKQGKFVTNITMPLHILVTTRGTAAGSYAGPGLTVRRLLKTHDQNETKDVTMSVVFGDTAADSYKALVPHIEKLTGGSRKRAPGSLRFAVGYTFSIFRYMFTLTRAMRSVKHKSIVVHAHDLVSAYLTRFLYHSRYPVIFTLHGKGGYVREPMLQYQAFRGTFVEKFWRSIERSTIRDADVIVFTSKGSQALFENEYPGLLQAKDVRIIHPGLETLELDTAPTDRAILKKYGVAEGTPVILCISALVVDKGVDTLIDAIGGLPADIRSKLSCLVVGRGHLKDELQSLIVKKELAGTIKLLDFMPRDDLLGLLKSSDIFVLPSRVSVFDQVLLEVGAAGLPLITTAVGGNIEMYDDNSAILIPPDNPPALTDAILRMLTDEGLRKRLSETAKQRIRSRFSPESEFNSYTSIYGEVGV
jgi:glycosyltransferase involved in cell wall biosynthesis